MNNFEKKTFDLVCLLVHCKTVMINVKEWTREGGCPLTDEKGNNLSDLVKETSDKLDKIMDVVGGVKCQSKSKVE